MTYMNESYESADQVISSLSAQGHDYSAYREEIARAFDEGIYEGNWDWTTDINVEGIQELRLIQEDQYDQHMDDDPDKPDWDDMLCSGPAYVWFAQ
jgi:hypothetical protein